MTELPVRRSILNRNIAAHRDLQSLEITRRLVNCLPSASFEMETFCRLAGLEISRRVPTAAVECVLRPRLLLNPDFLAQYCQRDEHLFLLVMHELWHIILAHTRLYPRATLAENIAFDAIINSGLSRQFRQPEYRGFFDVLNPNDEFPQVLLRPPAGWPDAPEYPDVTPAGTREILMRLYPPPDGRDVAPPLYDEILDLLRDYAREHGLYWDQVILIGDHEDPNRDGRALDDPLLKDMLRRMIKRWPKMKFGGSKQRGGGGEPEEMIADIERSVEQARRAFANTLRRCLNPGHGRLRRRSRLLVPGMAGISVLPNARDRMAPAKRLLGAPSTLWGQPGQVKARVSDAPGKAYIYLDVSGSMADLLPHLLSLVIPYVAGGRAEVFQFSTIVEPLPLRSLKTGRIQTTGGTDINCVMEHALDSRPAPRRILLVTDGYTGEPEDTLAARAYEQHLRVHVVLPAEESSADDLRSIATSIVTLPPLYGI